MRPKPVRLEQEADLELARRCIEEISAREECFRRYAQPVFRLARRLLGNAADAEDVLQEVFVEVFASIGNYRGEAPLKSWLYRITVRRAFRHRGRSVRQARLELVAGESPRDAGLNTSNRLDSRAILRSLSRALDRLDEDKRAIFILHEVEGYSLPEAAALLGVSVTAAKKRVWRARRELEKLGRRDPALRPFFSDGSDLRDGF